jgi:hypothetical protein
MIIKVTDTAEPYECDCIGKTTKGNRFEVLLPLVDDCKPKVGSE